MKRVGVFVFLLIFATLELRASPLCEEHPYHFVITQDDYTFSTVFEIITNNTYPGTVKKSNFRVRTHYDLSNEQGWQATGITRILSMGLLYSWATEIDIYDTRGQKIGMIDGQVMTTEAAKLSLYQYDDHGNSKCVGIAYLNQTHDGFIIRQPSGPITPIAIFDRVYPSSGHDYWDVRVQKAGVIDDRIIRIFAAFVIDKQNKFCNTSVDDDVDM